MKVLKVKEDLHLQVKAQASAKGMTIQAYVQYLVDKDK